MPSPWILAALFVLSLAALAVLVRAVLRTLSGARLCDLPLRERQEAAFDAAGPVILCMEGPRFTPRFRRLVYELRLPGGAPVAGRPVLFRTVTSGIARARVTLRRFDLPYAGRYQLAVHGLEPADVGAAGHRIVFMRPHTARSVALVVGITLASALAVASLVLFLLAVIPSAAAIDPGRAEGWVELDGERVELPEAYAHLHPNREGRLPYTPELRIALADREIPQESLRGLDELPVLGLAAAGRVRGLLLRLDPDEPGTLSITLLAPASGGHESPGTRHYTGTAEAVVRRLRLAPTRVGGEITCPPGGPRCELRFSAPVFNE
jgi:hypothetical protein